MTFENNSGQKSRLADVNNTCCRHSHELGTRQTSVDVRKCQLAQLINCLQIHHKIYSYRIRLFVGASSH